MGMRLIYNEGTRFLVPLRKGGFGQGVVARMDGKGSVFGYFFGPKLSNPNELDENQLLAPEEAVMIRKFGDLGFLNGEWTIVGTLFDWERERWPMPPLIRVDEHAGKAYLSTYDDQTFECLKEEIVSPSLVDKYPPDSGSGYGAIEIRLTKLLDKQ